MKRSVPILRHVRARRAVWLCAALAAFALASALLLARVLPVFVDRASDVNWNVTEITGGHEGLRCLAFSPTADLLVTGSTSGDVRGWNPTTKNQLFQECLGQGWIEMVRFSADGRVFAAVGQGLAVTIFNAATLRKTQTLQADCAALSMALLPDGRTVVLRLMNGEVLTREIATGRKVGSMEGKWDLPKAIEVSATGDAIAVGGLNGMLSMGALNQGRLSVEVKATAGHIVSMAFSPDGSMLATGDTSGQLSLWDSHSGRREAQWTAHEGRINSLTYVSETVIVSSGSFNRLRFWSVRDARLLQELAVEGGGPVECFAYSARNRCLGVAFYDGALKLVDLPEEIKEK